MPIPNAQDLQLHLKADVGVVLNAGEVETWQDQSGNGNDCMQAVVASRPMPVVDAAGRQGVAFSNSKTETLSMDIPAGVSVNLADISVFAVTSLYGKINQPNAVIAFDTAANKGALGYWSPTSADPSFLFTSNNAGSGLIATNIHGHYGLATIGYSSDATSIRFYDQSNTGTALAMTGSGTGGVIGRFGAPDGYPGTIYEILVYNRALTAAESLAVIEYLKKRHGILDITKNIVFEGDSITEGFGSTHNGNYPFYADLPGFRVKNAGTFGHNWANLLGQGAALDTHYLDLSLTSVITAFCGTNDVVAGGRSAADIATDAQAWALARKTAGWSNIGMITMLPRSTAAHEIVRQELNALLRDTAINSWDFVIDVEDDPAIGGYGANLDTTYYDADGVHLNSEGYKRIALLIQKALLDFLYPNTNIGVVTQKASTGRGLYFTIEDLNGNLWDGLSFTQQNMSGWLSHLAVMGEEVADSGKYRGLFPADIPVGTYKIIVHSRELTDQPAPADMVESFRFVQWTGGKLFSEGLPQEVDGMTDTSLKEVMLAYIGGMSSVVDNGDGTRTITYKKQDGITSKLVITFNANGEFTETQVA